MKPSVFRVFRNQSPAGNSGRASPVKVRRNCFAVTAELTNADSRLFKADAGRRETETRTGIFFIREKSACCGIRRGENRNSVRVPPAVIPGQEERGKSLGRRSGVSGGSAGSIPFPDGRIP